MKSIINILEQNTNMANIQTIDPEVAIEGKEMKNTMCGDKSSPNNHKI